MFFTVTVCPCCDDVDIFPDYELELDANQYIQGECAHCAHTEDSLDEDIPF